MPGPDFNADTTSSVQTRPALAELLSRKNLPAEILHPDNHQGLSVSSDIGQHAEWVYKNIYSVRYPDHAHSEEASESEKSVARLAHGLMHVSRAAIYVSVFANLYRKHGFDEAHNLEDEDIKLMQIAALFHDAAREDENVDRWDHESALLLYHYLRDILRIDPAKASAIAEATANKDLDEKGYFEIREDEQGNVQGTYNSTINKDNFRKSIYHKLIHDADCLDIIRARPHFDAKYLDLHLHIQETGNELALKEMAGLVCEARSLIEKQGDAFFRLNLDIKARYEHAQGFSAIHNDTNDPSFPILQNLGQGLRTVSDMQEMQLVDLTPYDPEKGLTQDNLEAGLRDGVVLVRSLRDPSNTGKISKDKNGSRAELEASKTMRAPGIATTSSKADNMEKHGNPLRSMSVLGYGAGVYSSAGFLLLHSDDNNLKEVHGIDADTGHGKKSHLRGKQLADVKELSDSFKRLRSELMLGGQSRTFPDSLHFANHTEIMYDCKTFDAVYFTNDPNFSTYRQSTQPTPPSLPILQAIYIRNTYERAWEENRQKFIAALGAEEGDLRFKERFGDKKSLPVIEYSGYHNRIRILAEAELSDDNILEHWRSLCRYYITDRMSFQSVDVLFESAEQIKKDSVFYVLGAQNPESLDCNYPPHLRAQINQMIVAEQASLIASAEDKLVEDLVSGKISILSNKVFSMLQNSVSFEEKLRNNPAIPHLKHHYFAAREEQSASPFYGAKKYQHACISLVQHVELLDRLGLDVKQRLGEWMESQPIVSIRSFNAIQDVLRQHPGGYTPFSEDWLVEHMKSSFRNLLQEDLKKETGFPLIYKQEGYVMEQLAIEHNISLEQLPSEIQTVLQDSFRQIQSSVKQEYEDNLIKRISSGELSIHSREFYIWVYASDESLLHGLANKMEVRQLSHAWAENSKAGDKWNPALHVRIIHALNLDPVACLSEYLASSTLNLDDARTLTLAISEYFPELPLNRDFYRLLVTKLTESCFPGLNAEDEYSTNMVDWLDRAIFFRNMFSGKVMTPVEMDFIFSQWPKGEARERDLERMRQFVIENPASYYGNIATPSGPESSSSINNNETGQVDEENFHLEEITYDERDDKLLQLIVEVKSLTCNRVKFNTLEPGQKAAAKSLLSALVHQTPIDSQHLPYLQKDPLLNYYQQWQSIQQSHADELAYGRPAGALGIK